MKVITALGVLQEWDARGRFVFTTGDLSRMFREPRGEAALSGTLTRLCREGVLGRAGRGVYVYRLASSLDSTVLARIALASRRGEVTIESYETAAARWGIISQTFARSLSVMTTGRSARIDTEWGSITLVHTTKSPSYLYEHSVARPETPLRIATERLTLAALYRSGRMLNLEYESRKG